MGVSLHRVDWESLWSSEARKKQLPSLHGIVSRYTKEPDVIGMHGGLPPSNTFPFTWFHAGLLPLSDGSADDDAAAAAAAAENGKAPAVQLAAQMQVDDPLLVATAQQYNMQAQGYAPLVSWAREMVISLHKPATLHSSSSSSSSDSPAAAEQPQQQPCYEPVGMEVVITPGASAALDSLVRVLVNPGEPVLVEEFTYAHMVEAHLLPLGCELLPVPLDAGGLVPSALDDLLTVRAASGQAMPKLLYTIPTGQNPTGSVMDAERMSQVYAVARKWGLVIVEDDAYYWLQYPQGPDNVPGLNLRPGFLSLDVDGRVVRVDTLAKLLGPGFRLGWLTGPPALVNKLGLYMAGISIGANMVSQVLLHELLANTWGRTGFEAFVKRLQVQYARQAAVAAQAAEQQLAGLAQWLPAQAGMFMWFRLTGDLDSQCLIEAAAAHKVMVVPGHLISVPHLQAAHRRKLLLQQQQTTRTAVNPQQVQQQQQQGAQEVQGDCRAPSAEGDVEHVLTQLHGLTQQLQQLHNRQHQQLQLVEGDAQGDDSSKQGQAGGGGDVAAQLEVITQQLHRLRQLGSSSAHPPAGDTAAADTPSSSSSAAAVSVSAGGNQVASCDASSNVSLEVSTQAHMPCPFFRVSFVSVPAEAIQQGFVRLRAAILSCHGPKTPPGEESEISSCSSSIGSSVASGSSHAVTAVMVLPGGRTVAAAATSDSAMC